MKRRALFRENAKQSTYRVMFTARLRRVADGVERLYVFDEEPGEFAEDYHQSYMWSEGNYGCDCNRALFFARAAGEEAWNDERPCGDGERYQLLSLTRAGESQPFWTPETDPWGDGPLSAPPTKEPRRR